MIAASYNVHRCVGSDRRRDPGRIADVIAETGAELVAVQEADRRFGAPVGLLDAEALEARAGLRLVPVSGHPRGQGWRGNALLVGRSVRIASEPLRIRLPGAEPRGALMVDLDFGWGEVRVITAHLGLLPGSRTLQAEAILEAHRRAGPKRAILLGDLNEWRDGKSALGVLGTDFWPSRGGAATFPARRPMLRLDRIMGHPRGLVSEAEAHDTPLARAASDHLPVKARVGPSGGAAAAG